MERFNSCAGGINGRVQFMPRYNLFYRNGRIDAIRAEMRAEMRA